MDRARQARILLTFDDGPLPADITLIRGRREEELLAPLHKILSLLARYQKNPISAIFFLRGPGRLTSSTSQRTFRREAVAIHEAGHSIAVHCFNHDPELWYGWKERGDDVAADLNRFVDFFGAALTKRMIAFRPPYGEGGPVARSWAEANGFPCVLWDIDSRDWLHHDDAMPAPSFRYDIEAHREHINAALARQMLNRDWGTAVQSVLMHVSARTALLLPGILDHMQEICLTAGMTPAFVPARSRTALLARKTF